MQLKKVKVVDIIPYDKNPRYNDEAVSPVKESIKQCTYISPIIVDENMIVLAFYKGDVKHIKDNYGEIEVMEMEDEE